MSKIGVTYKMSSNNEIAESYIEIPIMDNLKPLVDARKAYSRTYYSILTSAIKNICALQGYCFDSIETLELIE